MVEIGVVAENPLREWFHKPSLEFVAPRRLLQGNGRDDPQMKVSIFFGPLEELVHQLIWLAKAEGSSQNDASADSSQRILDARFHVAVIGRPLLHDTSAPKLVSSTALVQIDRREGIGLAARLNPPIMLAHVVEPTLLPQRWLEQISAPHGEQSVARAELEPFAAAAQSDSVSITTTVMEGRASKALVNLATERRASLIILGLDRATNEPRHRPGTTASADFFRPTAGPAGAAGQAPEEGELAMRVVARWTLSAGRRSQSQAAPRAPPNR
jgi:hypothetical protein